MKSCNILIYSCGSHPIFFKQQIVFSEQIGPVFDCKVILKDELMKRLCV